MDNIKDKQSGFNVESILLTESSFTRKGKINFSESEQEVSFETGVGSVILKYWTMNSLVELMVLPSFFLLFVSILPISH